MSETERCSKCGQMKTAQRAGSLTQWIALCGCDSIDASTEDQSPSIQFCSICSKRIATERKGSLTQFIFRSDTCKCPRPQVIEKPVEELLDFDPGSAMAEELSEEELQAALQKFNLSLEKFPFDRYTPVKVIGQGSSGVVYHAIDRLLQKPVAIKCLHWIDQSRLVNFQNEARATSKLNHEGIVTIYDFGATTGGVPYMVMESVNGGSLSTQLQEKHKLAPMQAVSLVIAIAHALANAHAQRIFHRDVKPSNIILCGDISNPAVKIIDFGVAQFNRDTGSITVVNGHTLAGTPLYMPPELATGESYSAASEVYSLGCVLFECLTGVAPFNAENSLAVVRLHINEAPPLVSDLADDIAPELDEVISVCLQKKPEDRYASMQELVIALEAVRAQSQENSHLAAREDDLELPTLKMPFPKQTAKSRRSLVFGVAALLLIAVAGISMYSGSHEKPEQEKFVDFKEPDPDKRYDEGTNFTDGVIDSIDLDNRLTGEGKGTRKVIEKFLQTHKQARTVMLRGEELTDDLLPGICTLEPSLVSLTNCRNLTDNGLKNLAKLEMLGNLTLDENPQITPKGYANLALVPHLEELSLKNCDLDDQDMKALSKLKHLQSLDVSSNPRVTVKGLDVLGNRTNIVYVKITGCSAEKASDNEKNAIAGKNNLTISSSH